MRISDWSSDVCSSDLLHGPPGGDGRHLGGAGLEGDAELGPHGPRGASDAAQVPAPLPRQIGRASCRERVCQYVSLSGVAVSLKNKVSCITESTNSKRLRQ